MAMFTKKKMAVMALTTGVLLGAQSAFAFTAEGIYVQELLSESSEGQALAGVTAGGDTHFSAQLVHPGPEVTQNSMLVVFSGCSQDADILGTPVTNLQNFLLQIEPEPLYNTAWTKPGPRWTLCPQENALLISPGDTARAKFDVDFLRRPANEGMSPLIKMNVYEVSPEDLATYTTAFKLANIYADHQPTAIVPLSVHYRIVKGIWKYGSYADVYGTPPKSTRSGGVKAKNYDAVKNTTPVNVGSFLAGGKLPAHTKYDNNASLETAYANVLAQGACIADDATVCPEQKSADQRAMTSNSAPKNVSHVISGIFSTKWVSDHSLHPGLGFRVDITTNAIFGFVSSLGTAWVQPNGSWTLNVPASLGFNGGTINISYRAYNEYFAPQNKDGRKYWFNGGSWVVDAPTFNIMQFADTDGGAYSGLGEVVEAAERVWMRTYWDAQINPVPSAPIKMYVPNTWNTCSSKRTSPWSCASPSGDQIWLIPEHTVEASTVAHEMGHALQTKFWGGKHPAGSGGPHGLDGCFPNKLGLPLEEGFASFFAMWVGFPDRNVAEGVTNSTTAKNISNVPGRWSAGGFDIETNKTNYVCSQGYENELWVARAFWDLHDTRIDGLDWITFKHQGGVIAGYLLNGVSSNGDDLAMYNFEYIYRQIVNSFPVGNYAPAVTNAFIQNGTQTGFCPGGGALWCPGE
ncbi:MAG: hypothetical protein NTY50_21980 [Methylobacter sp.]|nr:hypothetical protein [Methylobacter sp.]